MNKDEFLLLYETLLPLENVDQSKAIEIIVAMMHKIIGDTPEMREIDGVVCIGTLKEGMFLISDGIIDAVIEDDNGQVLTAKVDAPVN